MEVHGETIEYPAGKVNLKLPLRTNPQDQGSIGKMRHQRLAKNIPEPVIDPNMNIHQEIRDDKSVSNKVWDSYPTFIQDDSTDSIFIENISEPTGKYQYSSFGKGDPFVPPMFEIHQTTVEIPIVSVLQKYSLDKLAVVGIWELDNGERKTLIMTEDGEGVIAKKGEFIGQKGGTILEILPSNIVVREFFVNLDGTRQFSDTELYLGKQAEDEPSQGTPSAIEISKSSPTKSGASIIDDFIKASTTQKPSDLPSTEISTSTESAETPTGQPEEKLPFDEFVEKGYLNQSGTDSQPKEKKTVEDRMRQGSLK
jgi:Tfp pilus assembly protein PilP